MTPEQRSTELRKRAKTRARNRRHRQRQANAKVRHGASSEAAQALPKHVGNISHGPHVAYLYGKVETIIEYYANSNGIPIATLAAGLASLLRHGEGG